MEKSEKSPIQRNACLAPLKLPLLCITVRLRQLHAGAAAASWTWQLTCSNCLFQPRMCARE